MAEFRCSPMTFADTGFVAVTDALWTYAVSPSLRHAEGRQLSSGDERSQPIAARDRKKQMRRVVRIVVYGDMGRLLSPDLAQTKILNKGFGGFVVDTFDLQLEAVARREQDAVGTNLDVEFVNTVWLQRISSCVKVDRLPGF